MTRTIWTASLAGLLAVVFAAWTLQAFVAGGLLGQCAEACVMEMMDE